VKVLIKAYKSLSGYNYFVNGWVDNVKAFPVPSSDSHLVLANVRHSQRLSSSPVRCWVVDGCVLFGRCTCMAGLGEACSALLFTLEATLLSSSITDKTVFGRIL